MGRSVEDPLAEMQSHLDQQHQPDKTRPARSTWNYVTALETAALEGSEPFNMNHDLQRRGDCMENCLEIKIKSYQLIKSI